MKHARKMAVLGAAVIGVIAAMAPLPSFADAEYIITPGYDPAAASLAGSSSAKSPGASLATGTYSTPAASPVSLEARFRTWLESLGTALKSTRLRRFFINFE